MRLNTPPMRLDGDHFLSTLHTYHRRGYRTWLYTFSAHPPFAVLAISREPVILPEDAVGENPRNRRHRCVFVHGMSVNREADELLLTGGNNDAAVGGVALKTSAVLKALQPLGH